MKTLKSVQTADERAAKITALIVNTSLTLAGLAFCGYGLFVWAANHAFKF